MEQHAFFDYLATVLEFHVGNTQSKGPWSVNFSESENHQFITIESPVLQTLLVALVIVVSVFGEYKVQCTYGIIYDEEKVVIGIEIRLNTPELDRLDEVFSF